MKNERISLRSACMSLIASSHSAIEYFIAYDADDSYMWRHYDIIEFLEAKLIAIPEASTPKNTLGAMFPQLANLKG